MGRGMKAFADRHRPPPSDERPDAYTWDDRTGWKSYRMLNPFRGMYYDVKRRLPWYLSDITDGLNYHMFAATVRIYFVKWVSRAHNFLIKY